MDLVQSGVANSLLKSNLRFVFSVSCWFPRGSLLFLPMDSQFFGAFRLQQRTNILAFFMTLPAAPGFSFF
uniref:Uncharacterized protein n=1 Tax=Arundo donax TaxID=35708 RepID=A0A0A9GZY9_ARUDO